MGWTKIIWRVGWSIVLDCDPNETRFELWKFKVVLFCLSALGANEFKVENANCSRICQPTMLCWGILCAVLTVSEVVLHFSNGRVGLGKSTKKSPLEKEFVVPRGISNGRRIKTCTFFISFSPSSRCLRSHWTFVLRVYEYILFYFILVRNLAPFHIFCRSATFHIFCWSAIFEVFFVYRYTREAFGFGPHSKRKNSAGRDIWLFLGLATNGHDAWPKTRGHCWPIRFFGCPSSAIFHVFLSSACFLYFLRFSIVYFCFSIFYFSLCVRSVHREKWRAKTCVLRVLVFSLRKVLYSAAREKKKWQVEGEKGGRFALGTTSDCPGRHYIPRKNQWTQNAQWVQNFDFPAVTEGKQKKRYKSTLFFSWKT